MLVLRGVDPKDGWLKGVLASKERWLERVWAENNGLKTSMGNNAGPKECWLEQGLALGSVAPKECWLYGVLALGRTGPEECLPTGCWP